jgi:hypothetical protein
VQRRHTHGAVQVHLGAEFLAQLHRHLDHRPGGGVAGERGVLHVLGPDAENHLPAEVALQGRVFPDCLVPDGEPVRPEAHLRAAVAALHARLDQVHGR